MTTTDHTRLRRCGYVLEIITLGWNVVGVIILAVLALAASSVALAGFGLDSLIEIGASTVVLWELSGTGQARQRLALRLIGAAFVALAVYLLIQSTGALISKHHASASAGGITWTAVTAIVMFGLALGKGRTGKALANHVLVTEGRVTFIDGLLATAVLLGLVLNLAFGWWWADPMAGYVIVYYAIRESIDIFRPDPPQPAADPATQTSDPGDL
jgi:divalent metal cation (Fe/Co/Zn/Cd) transporter